MLPGFLSGSVETRQFCSGNSEMTPQSAGIVPLESRPGIFLVGSLNVGKRTLLSRLISADLSDASDTSSEFLCYGWTINTKYYTADIAIWMAHLDERSSIGSLPISEELDALVMVFDMNELSSFTALQDWVSHTDIHKFEVLVCIGNKADLLPGHFAHGEYRRRLQKHGESFSDPHPEFLEYGILETEGSSLLGDEEPSWEIRRSCLEWCSQHNIEYIEACAANAEFDKCLSVDGDSQGVERLYGALSAHMWPGMVLKSGNRMPECPPPEKEGLSDEESDYEIEYELLSKGSAEPWDGVDESWDALNDLPATTDEGRPVNGNIMACDRDKKHEASDEDKALTLNSDAPTHDDVGTEVPRAPAQQFDTNDEAKTHASTSVIPIHENFGAEVPRTVEQRQETADEATIFIPTSEVPVKENSGAQVSKAQDEKHKTDAEAQAQCSNSKVPHVQEVAETNVFKAAKSDQDMNLGMEDLEQLMCEIGNMRENLRLMPDFHRKEMAAKLAMKMAAMFAESSDEEAFDLD